MVTVQNNNAILRIAPPYTKTEISKIEAEFSARLEQDVRFTVKEDSTLLGGFIAMIDGIVYDNSLATRLQTIRHSISGNQASAAQPDPELMSVSSYLKNRIAQVKTEPSIYKYGMVKSCQDDVVQIDGLPGIRFGEILEFDGGGYALALDLRLDGAGAVLLTEQAGVKAGLLARGTGRVAEICVGSPLLGRVIDPIGRPLDGKELKCNEYRPIETAAPTIMQRSPVNTPLETGILSIDSLIPIGRGQRELIIGDRQTGKTSIALSAIINQARLDSGVISVYCAIGQKASTVASVVNTLEQTGAMKNTIVVMSTASDSAAMQYLAPYAACAIAEKFMYEGKDVLVVYDDLSKHATAYRTISLLLRRPSGREAYPGDVFYLHSRLLERAAKLSDSLGGGSITAMPIVETMAGDISAYIPTNIISITDGQIYLESELFHAGFRPAVNVGLSVSRVGRAAQHSALKSVSGSLRLDIAMYRDMAVFSQFGADIDQATATLLKSGERLDELLKQPVDEMLPLAKQVAVLLAAQQNVFMDYPVSEVSAKKRYMFERLDRLCPHLMARINHTGELRDEDKDSLIGYIQEIFKGDGNA